eukprot:scpid89110/ scgid6247/ Rho GTPase-activating protein 35; GAP-associated protein p190; Glucocorticoid receptor DNA-binding factor 1
MLVVLIKLQFKPDSIEKRVGIKKAVNRSVASKAVFLVMDAGELPCHTTQFAFSNTEIPEACFSIDREDGSTTRPHRALSRISESYFSLDSEDGSTTRPDRSMSEHGTGQTTRQATCTSKTEKLLKTQSLNPGIGTPKVRRRRLAKKRISPSATSLSSVEAQSPVQNRTGHFQRQDGVSAPWEASSLVTSGPYFGVNLDALPPRSDNSTIPLFVDKCIAFIEERAMSTRGIYRLSGISSAITELEEMYTADHNLNLFSVCDDRPDRYDENCIASSLKSFLRKIPDPVVPASITSRLVEIPTLDQDTQSMVDRLKLIVVFGMPQRNRALLQEICCHLQRVAEHASENLMKASNLAVVFWPNLLRPAMEGSDMVLMRDLPRLLQNVLTLLIEHAEEVFIENQPW